MTAPSITTTQLNPPHRKEVILTARLRRELLQKLDQLDQTLLHFNQQDRLTQIIRAWKDAFRAVVNTDAFTTEIKDRFFNQLKESLVDALPCQVSEGSIIYPPLDDEALLGSDGFVYGKKWLSILWKQLPEQLRTRSPLNPEQPTPFSVQPHEPARFLVRWLHDSGVYEPLAQLEQMYAQQRDQMPPLPGLAQPSQGLQERLNRLKQKTAAVNHQVDQESRQKLSEQKSLFQKELDAKRQILNGKITEDNEEFKAEVAALLLQYTEAETATQQLLVAIEKVKGSLASCSQELAELEDATLRLEQEVASSKQDGMKAVWAVAASIVITIVLNQLLPGAQVLLQSSSASIGLVIPV